MSQLRSLVMHSDRHPKYESKINNVKHLRSLRDSVSNYRSSIFGHQSCTQTAARCIGCGFYLLIPFIYFLTTSVTANISPKIPKIVLIPANVVFIALIPFFWVATKPIILPGVGSSI